MPAPVTPVRRIGLLARQVLTTARLGLEPLEGGHTPELVRLWSDPALWRYEQTQAPDAAETTTALRHFRALAAAGQGGLWALRPRGGDADADHGERDAAGRQRAGRGRSPLVGTITLQPDDEAGWLQLGFALCPSAQGQGLAQEGVTAVLQHVFATATVQGVRGYTDPENRAARRLMTRVGLGAGEGPTVVAVQGVARRMIEHAAPAARWPGADETHRAPTAPRARGGRV